MKPPLIRFCQLLLAVPLLPLATAHGETLVEFEKQTLTERFFSEGACYADIDGDGHQDVVSGPFWYAGPEFTTKHAYDKPLRVWIKQYSEFFFTFAYDFNGDQRPDILAVPMPGQTAHWYENPGRTGVMWAKHAAFTDVGNESPQLTDLTGDGKPELVCCHQGKLVYAEPNWTAPMEPWTFTEISGDRGYGRFTHGLGIGDVNGDGRMDVLETNGWWEQTATQGEFVLRPQKFAQAGGAQMFAEDIDGDGDQDVVSSQNAHAWGLAWFEQTQSGDAITFRKHLIMTKNPAENPYGLAFSQMHAVAMADMDGDGLKDIVTGKRFYAHGGGDPGSHELPVLYWFKTIRDGNGVTFEPWLIDERAGVGTQLTVGDVTGDGRPDVIVGNKLGTFVLRQQAQEISAESYVERRPKKRAKPVHVVGSDLFASHVRATEPLTAEEELGSFVLPEGFEIQLVAAEPDIAKPTNMAIDARGRVWVTSTEEYPYAVTEDRPTKDSIKILEDTTGDGRADKIITFADNLNIPMGLYPYRDGVVCFSIPYIWFLRDTDGDGRCDVREKLYGPLGFERDTHGMCNSFTRGFDGWLYACHGFNNETALAGTDGHEIRMQSGNIFRMKLDGSRVELVTRGQVNPFGLTFSQNGDLFVADCHTKPISLLLRGGYQQSFGKPHDGLGFIPNVMEHSHGSTAICGIMMGESAAFPEEYRDSIFSGNVTSCRINRNTLAYRGSSPRAQEEADFLVSNDPWFRPVDLQVGLDGALYVADFYNRVIGHYEVGLDHPGRDRHRGRLWKIVHRDHKQAPPDLTKQSLERLSEHLHSPIRNRAVLALEQILERFAKQAPAMGQQLIQEANPAAQVRGLWLLERCDALADAELTALATAQSSVVREHVFRVFEARENAPSATLLAGFSDSAPRVRRAAVMAASTHLSDDLMMPLLGVIRDCPEGDVHLRYAARMALRNHLRDEDRLRSLGFMDLTDAELRHIASLCLALKSPMAADFLVTHLERLRDASVKEMNAWLQFAVRYAKVEALDKIAQVGQQRYSNSPQFQLGLLKSIHQGLQERGQQAPASIEQWATQVAAYLLGDLDAAPALSWRYVPHAKHPGKDNPWVVSNKRRCADGPEPTTLWSSFPTGETKTGIFRSDAFVLPERFSFYLGGHDGAPSGPLQGKNMVRLRDAATHVVIHEIAPPRNDVAQQIVWETRESRQAYIELIDGDTGTAYAWMAIGRFSVPGLNPSGLAKDRKQAAELVEKYQLKDLRPALVRLLKKSGQSERSLTLARALANTPITDNARGTIRAAAEALAIDSLDRNTRSTIISAIEVDDNGWSTAEVLSSVMKAATGTEQLAIASQLVTDKSALPLLLGLVEQGAAGASLLTQPAIAQSINAIADAEQKALVKKLTAALPDRSEALDALIAERIGSCRDKEGRPNSGKTLFKTLCMACHQVGGEGQNLAPNLDGIGNRGLDRLVEDILDPNRNVDSAFRVTTLVLQDGSAASGFMKLEEDGHVVLADAAGQEQTIALDQIKERVASTHSLMPATFGQTLTETRFRDLMSWLLTLR